VVVAQTGLHRLYPAGMAHPIPYPYTLPAVLWSRFRRAAMQNPSGAQQLLADGLEGELRAILQALGQSRANPEQKERPRRTASTA
jgi:hypothetical protein